MTVDQVRTTLRERIARGATLDELDTLLRMSRGLTERERTTLWSEAWRYDPRQLTQRRVRSVRSLLARVRPRARSSARRSVAATEERGRTRPRARTR